MQYPDYLGVERDGSRLVVRFDGFDVAVSTGDSPQVLAVSGDAPADLDTALVGRELRAQPGESRYEQGVRRFVPNRDDGGYAVEVDLFWTGEAPSAAGEHCNVVVRGPGGGALARRGDLWVQAPLDEDSRDSVIYVELLELQELLSATPEVTCTPPTGAGFDAPSRAMLTRSAPEQAESGGAPARPFGLETAWATASLQWRGKLVPNLWRCDVVVRDADGTVVDEGSVIVPGVWRNEEPSQKRVAIPVDAPGTLEGKEAAFGCIKTHELAAYSDREAP